MPTRRLIYRTWLADTVGSPDQPTAASQPHGPRLISLSDLPPELLSTEDFCTSDEDIARQRLLRRLVQTALGRLTQNEREFIEQFYLRGVDYGELVRRSGRTFHNLSSLHRRALRRLRKELAGPVRQLYGIELAPSPKCTICQSCHRREIDRLLQTRDRTQPWPPIMRQIRSRYKVVIKSPQTIISHERFH